MFTVIPGSPYAHTEASQRASEAIDILNYIVQSQYANECLCMSLYYHMYGVDIGRLEVVSRSEIQDNFNIHHTLWYMNGGKKT